MPFVIKHKQHGYLTSYGGRGFGAFARWSDKQRDAVRLTLAHAHDILSRWNRPEDSKIVKLTQKPRYVLRKGLMFAYAPGCGWTVTRDRAHRYTRDEVARSCLTTAGWIAEPA